MNIYDPVFSSSATAQAAGMTHSSFRAYLAKDKFGIMEGDHAGQKAEVFGKGHLFTIYDVLGYALAWRLVQRGVDPKVAFQRAMYDFAHVGDEQRAPGDVLSNEHGFTLFVYSPGAARAQIVGHKDLYDPIALLVPPGHQRAGEAIIIVLNDLRTQVFNALGIADRLEAPSR